MSYYQRLFTVCDQIEKLANTPNVKKISANLYDALYEWMQESALSPALGLSENNLLVLNSPKIFFKTFDYATSLADLLKNLYKLPTNKTKLADMTVGFIDTILSHCYELHSLIHTMGNTVIEYPRSILLKSEQEGEQSAEALLLFQVDAEKLQEIMNKELNNINSINGQRDRKYNYYLQLGHEAIFHKRPEKALEHFQRAAIYQNSAEVLTLIGWSYAQLGKIEKAKQSCVEAIKVDDQYGAAYNDLGSYLLTENRLEEALKWFEVAKSATHYQNREYPYINASKIYMTTKNYAKALNELEQAYKLAPYHEELKEMIAKIKHLLDQPKESTQPPTPQQEAKPRFTPTLV